VTNTPPEYAYLKLPMVEDIIKGLGPIGGIYTGLETIADEAGFFVACDMPFLNKDLFYYMVDVRDDFDAVVPRVGWMVEPLHALYTKKCLPVIRKSLDSRVLQIMRFFEKIRIRYVDEEEIRGIDPHLKSLFNINRPEDLQALA
jgi:molybdopterin-guanine dinucleotide biosynthesis protein A